MSYNIEQKKADIFIARTNHKAILAKLKEALPKIDDVFRFNPRFHTVRRENLVEELTYWFFETRLDADYNIVGLKLAATFMPGGIDDMFKILAPYVHSGGEVLLSGEDGAQFRWIFSDGKVKKYVAKVKLVAQDFEEVEA